MQRLALLFTNEVNERLIGAVWIHSSHWWVCVFQQEDSVNVALPPADAQLHRTMNGGQRASPSGPPNPLLHVHASRSPTKLLIHHPAETGEHGGQRSAASNGIFCVLKVWTFVRSSRDLFLMPAGQQQGTKHPHQYLLHSKTLFHPSPLWKEISSSTADADFTDWLLKDGRKAPTQQRMATFHSTLRSSVPAASSCFRGN